MGGFIAQAFAVKYADRVDKLVLLSTDPEGIQADLASPDVWSQLLDLSGTPKEQAWRLLFLLFQKTSPNPSIANSATSWQRPARNYQLTF
jgi:pimeloyl-ACP methyl ester carboxylesterase